MDEQTIVLRYGLAEDETQEVLLEEDVYLCGYCAAGMAEDPHAECLEGTLEDDGRFFYWITDEPSEASCDECGEYADDEEGDDD